jgi:hypothetical protein
MLTLNAGQIVATNDEDKQALHPLIPPFLIVDSI